MRTPTNVGPSFRLQVGFRVWGLGADRIQASGLIGFNVLGRACERSLGYIAPQRDTSTDPNMLLAAFPPNQRETDPYCGYGTSTR